ncbi:MAG: SulP family inorganic anion transporter, partial [Caldilineaceae bacterium]|nr:SulP family inorganic anion transporter [Caldilineaceae bacterium]
MSARAEVLQAISRPVEASLQTLLRPVRFFRDYNPDDFPADLVAGITTGIILIPQSIAYALIAGLPPEVGLYTAIVAPIAAALWGSSNHLHTGPTNAESLLVLMIVSSVATSSDPIEFLLIAGLLTVLIGVMRLALGLLRAGFIINFISDAVMVGFTAGAGLLIITFQLSGLLGLDVERTFTFIDAARTLGQTWEGLHFVSLALGLGTVILIFALPQLHPRLPSLFLSVFLMSVLVASFGLAHRGVSVIAPVPAVLPPVANLPLTDFQLVAKLIPGALAIALIGLIEALTIARSIASQTGQHLDNNQEIVGQGVANILVGFLSGYCASGSFTRSRVNLNAGGKTPMTTLLSGVFVLVAVLTLGWAIRYLAKPVLAGFVIATAITLINLPHALQILRTSKSETFIMLVTWGSVFVFSLVEAVAIGITASLLVYVYKTSRPRVIPLVPDAKFKHLRERNPNKDPVCPQLDIIAIEGDLYFGAANHVEYLLRNRLADAGRQYHVLLNLQNMVRVD